MSADNWTTCPRCKVRSDIGIIASRQMVKDKYGKIPLEEWEEMKRSSDRSSNVMIDSTFREDYQIGMYEDGKFFVIYSGQCSKCNYAFNYRHEEEVNIPI